MAPASNKDITWIVPDVLAAMSRPYDLRATLKSLQGTGVGAIVTLTEHALQRTLVEQFGIDYHHMPLRDFTAPSHELIRQFIGIVKNTRQTGKSTVVHCLAGRGRSGTMAACYLVSLGRSSREAIDEVRTLRPGSIETVGQEEAVHEYAFRMRHR